MKERNSQSAREPMQTDNNQSGPGARPDATLGRDVQAKIGHQLRSMYEDVVNQGVPDRFADLLRQLDQADIAGAARKGSGE